MSSYFISSEETFTIFSGLILPKGDIAYLSSYDIFCPGKYVIDDCSCVIGISDNDPNNLVFLVSPKWIKKEGEDFTHVRISTAAGSKLFKINEALKIPDGFLFK
jgi:hypothetical protein